MHIFAWQFPISFRTYLATVPTNMVAYMWNTDRRAMFVRVIDVPEVAAPPSPQKPVMQATDPEPVLPDSELSADLEPVPADMAGPAHTSARFFVSCEGRM